ncbi:autoinducer binding domain-containing protein [Pseudomonas sp. RIT623]|uniref:autoinducer binding domain-containing protein n=1 Tax=Pseudomonas sp. RIT623 TaxID=2559075 RepID=UPI0014315B1F|nr:autoinducer binding domain-containing protein [Pseudomonas sp. RIT623]
MSMPEWTPEQFDLVLKQGGPRALISHAQSLIAPAGLDCLSVTLRICTAGPTVHFYHHSSFAPAWDQRYIADKLFDFDPSISNDNHCHGELPLFWHGRLFDEAMPLCETAAEFGISFSHGWSQSVFDARQNSTVLNVFRSHGPISTEEFYEHEARVLLLGSRLHAALYNYHLPEIPSPVPIPNLSKREREVLYAFIELKNAKRVARALSIKESTVHFHSNNARKKTGATSTMSAAYIMRDQDIREHTPPPGKGL